MSDLPEGYKMSEVGVIPEDWEVYSINQLIEENIIEKPLDGNHGNIHPKSKDFVNDGIPFIMANNIDDGILDLKNCNFIQKDQADNLQKGFSVSGDVLLTHKGTVGNTAIVGKISTDYIMLTPQVTYYRVKNKNRIKNEYIRYYFDSDTFQSILANLSGGGTRAYIGITNQWKLPFILPPLSEQQAIASALSDTDALITALEQLITKKRNIKQGAMQQLLTGEKRLPGFSGEWGVKNLGEVLKVRHGKSQQGIIDENGLYPILATGGEIGRANTFLYDKPSVLIGRKGTIDVPQYMKTPFWTIDTLFFTEISDNANPKFIFYKFNLIDWYSHNEASGVPSLNASKIEKIELPFPSTVKEQQAIAQILSDMDTEIEVLEQKQDKYKAIKQGMMQELLTGKTRLV